MRVLNPIENSRHKLIILALFDEKDMVEVFVLKDHPESKFIYFTIIKGKKAKAEFSYPAISRICYITKDTLHFGP